MTPHQESPWPTQLRDLLCSLFHEKELEHFVADQYPTIRDQVNWIGSRQDVALSAIDTLHDHGLIHTGFFSLLSDAVPARAGDIDVVRQAFERAAPNDYVRSRDRVDWPKPAGWVSWPLLHIFLATFIFALVIVVLVEGVRSEWTDLPALGLLASEPTRIAALGIVVTYLFVYRPVFTWVYDTFFRQPDSGIEVFVKGAQIAERLEAYYKKLVEALLTRLTEFLGDGDTGHMWSARLFDRMMLLAFLYPVVGAFLSWVVLNDVGAAGQALDLRPQPLTCIRYTLLGLLLFLPQAIRWTHRSWDNRVRSFIGAGMIVGISFCLSVLGYLPQKLMAADTATSDADITLSVAILVPVLASFGVVFLFTVAVQVFAVAYVGAFAVGHGIRGSSTRALFHVNALCFAVTFIIATQLADHIAAMSSGGLAAVVDERRSSSLRLAGGASAVSVAIALAAMGRGAGAIVGASIGGLAMAPTTVYSIPPIWALTMSGASAEVGIAATPTFRRRRYLLLWTTLLLIPFIISAVLPLEFPLFLLYFVVIPLVNGLFDFMSVGLTRKLLTLSHTCYSHPLKRLFLSSIDLIGAAVLMVGLVFSLAFVLEALNLTSRAGPGQNELLRLALIKDSLRSDSVHPADFWVYFTVLSTFIPTLFHAASAGAAVFLSVPQWLKADELRDARMPDIKKQWLAHKIVITGIAGVVAGTAIFTLPIIYILGVVYFGDLIDVFEAGQNAAVIVLTPIVEACLGPLGPQTPPGTI